MEYKLTDHVKQRYAERIMDRNDKTDIAVYISNNASKIYQDIEKMILYGIEIYEGASVVDYNKRPVKVILNGHWVVIIDPQTNRVVTLFEIDLGLGKEFNDQYIQRLCAKLHDAQRRYHEAEEEIIARTQTYKDLQEENNIKIAEYRKMIKSLENQNQNLAELIQEEDNNRMIADQEVREVIATFVGKKVF